MGGNTLDKGFWEQEHRQRHTSHGGPNTTLVTVAQALSTGTALDAGCGEGYDALWLAEHGWRVTAVDIAGAALDQARTRAALVDPSVAGRVDWLEADLTQWAPPAGKFDLVTSHYVHTTGTPEDLFDRVAAAVAPGGTLLVVGHHHDDPGPPSRIDAPVSLNPAALARRLDRDEWQVEVSESRPGNRPGHRDASLRATRRRP